MNLKIYNTSNSAKEAIITPSFITVRWYGEIAFSSTLTEKLNLTQRRISFAEDQENPGHWYLLLDRPDGFEIKNYRQNKNKSKAAYMRNRLVAKALFNSLEDRKEHGDSVRIPVQTKEVEENTFPILVNNAFSSRWAYREYKDLQQKQQEEQS